MPYKGPAQTPDTRTGINTTFYTSFTQDTILLDYNFISASICNKKHTPRPLLFFTPLQVLMFCGMYRTVEIIVYPELTEEKNKKTKTKNRIKSGLRAEKKAARLL